MVKGALLPVACAGPQCQRASYIVILRSMKLMPAGMLSFSPVIGIGTPPTPHPQASVPPPLCSGGRSTLDGERGGGGVPIPTRGHTLRYSLYKCTLWASQSAQVLQCFFTSFWLQYRYTDRILVILNVKELSKSILEKMKCIYSAQKNCFTFTKYCMSEKKLQ